MFAVAQVSFCFDGGVYADISVGTIGMALHDRVSEVIGFELVQSAVDDAILNAKRNALDRCRFVVGKAEVDNFCFFQHNAEQRYRIR